jgi:hypothetical protein
MWLARALASTDHSRHFESLEVIRPTRSFQTMRTAAATLHVKDEVHFVNRPFEVFKIAA